MFDNDLPLSDHDLDRIAALLPLVKSWCEAVEGELLRRMQAGVVMQNAAVVPTQARRKWIDEGEVKTRLVELLGSLDQAAPRVVLSPAQAEKVLGKAGFSALASLFRRESSGVKVAYQMAIPFDED